MSRSARLSNSPLPVIRTPLGVALITLLLQLLPSSLHAQTWTIKFAPGPKAGRQVLACESRDLSVDFLVQHAWCVSRIRHRGEVVGQPSGATGCVITWNGKATGTGHGGEVVRDITLTVNGKATPLLVDGAPRYNVESDAWSGNEVILLKRSVIGPFNHEAEFHLPAGGDHYTVEHRYQVNSEWPKGKITGYAYIFMHMMPTGFTEWLLEKDDGSAKSGALNGAKGYAFQDEPFRALACYAPEKHLGIAYIYLRESNLLNHLLDRGDEDRKFRASLAKREGYAVGDTFAYQMKVVQFTAAPADWKVATKAIIRETRKP